MTGLVYRAAVCGEGTILPITEMLGRRVLRQIDPLSAEGRALLSAGRVTIWFEDGARCARLPIHEVLEQTAVRLRARREAYPDLDCWTSHHDRMLKRIGRMKKTIRRTV